MFGSDDSDSGTPNDWSCEKCGNQTIETAEIATAGSKMQKMLDVESQKFDVIICQNCGYSELYSKESSRLEDVADFLT